MTHLALVESDFGSASAALKGAATSKRVTTYQRPQLTLTVSDTARFAPPAEPDMVTA